jgi:hypothetical protein
MLRQTFWRVRPGGLFPNIHVSTLMPLAFKVREAPKVRPLVACRVLSRLAHCPTIAWISIVAADHLGHVQRSVFIKACIERGIHTTRISLQTFFNCILLSLDLENAFNTISRRRFLA